MLYYVQCILSIHGATTENFTDYDRFNFNQFRYKLFEINWFSYQPHNKVTFTFNNLIGGKLFDALQII